MARKLFTKTNRLIVQHRLLIFLCVLIMILLAFPFVEIHGPVYMGLLEISFSILLIAGIYIVDPDSRILTVTILFGLLTMTVIWFNMILNYPQLTTLSLFLEIIFVGLTTGVIITHVLQYKRVSADKIYGASCGYFLLGIVWALIYTLIETTYPGAFKVAVQHYGSTSFSSHHFYFSQFLYYSFVTITTLGFGDIVPVHDIARITSSFEAMVGQLYLAVLISRLVGLHIVHTHRP